MCEGRRPLALPLLSPEHPTPCPGRQEVGRRLAPRVVSGVNPSHLMNLFTYEKGYCFVYYLSQLCGDPQRFDNFLRVSSPSRQGLSLLPRPHARPPEPSLPHRPTWRSTSSPVWWPRTCWTPS